jgi:hypothetical protein
MHHVDAANAAILETDGTMTLVGSSTQPFAFADAWIARTRAPAVRSGSSGEAARAIVDAPRPRSDESPALRGPSATTLFVDFDGARLRAGARGDLGELPCLAGDAAFPGLSVDMQGAQAIVDRVRALVDPYGIRVMWGEAPPPHLPRTTVVVGGEPAQLGLDASVTGYSCVVDCFDAWPWDLAIAFAGDAATIANTIAHEAGHTWGLDHVVELDHIMYPLNAVPTADWNDDACLEVSDQTSAVLCGEAHTAFCDEGRQNSRAELLAAFGPSRVDASPPEVSISVHADRLAVGVPAQVEVTYEDDAGTPGVVLRVPELDWQRVVTDGQASFTLPLPIGHHTIVVEAIDHGDNAAQASVEVDVDVDVDSTTAGTETGDGDGDASGDTGEAVDASSEGGAAADTASGCGCGVDVAPSPWCVATWGLVGGAARRRRRSSR